MFTFHTSKGTQANSWQAKQRNMFAEIIYGVLKLATTCTTWAQVLASVRMLRIRMSGDSESRGQLVNPENGR